MDENEVVSYESMPQLHRGYILTKAQEEKLREPFKDVIVVVRCKDCKHWTACLGGQCNILTVNGCAHCTSPDWFCADGEKK